MYEHVRLFIIRYVFLQSEVEIFATFANHCISVGQWLFTSTRSACPTKPGLFYLYTVCNYNVGASRCTSFIYAYTLVCSQHYRFNHDRNVTTIAFMHHWKTKHILSRYIVYDWQNWVNQELSSVLISIWDSSQSLSRYTNSAKTINIVAT